ncbi:hypothetical protein DSECCO2_570750 [anaerobic digester metagenome]
MREIKLGEKTYRVNASALALLFYRQEFGADLIKDFTKFSVEIERDKTNYDGLCLLQVLWAINKAAVIPAKQPSFEQWLAEMDSPDFSDVDFVGGILTTVSDGFFSAQSAIEKARQEQLK